MAGLFGGNQVQSNAPVISSMQIQTSCYGRPVPWVFGRQRVAPNLIHYEDFTAIPHTRSTGGGKGGGGGETTDYSYTAAVILALGSGQISEIGKVWKDKKQSSMEELKLDFAPGTLTQAAYPYMQTKHPDKALPYRGIAYVASGSYDLGNAATLGNHTFELQAPGSIKAQHSSSEVPDADISDVITAILTDKIQGLGLAPEAIGDLTLFRSFCLASGIWVSPAYIEQKNAYEYIRNLLTIGFADSVYSDGLLKIVPFSDVPVTGTLASYKPEIKPVELTEDDFLADGGDVIKITQKSSDEAFNRVQVKFADRANDYNDNIVMASDDADIEQHGLRAKEVVELREIADAAVAQRVADFILARSLYVVNTYEFRLSWKHVRLEPMDVLLLSYAPKYLDKTPVIITEITESDDGVLTVLAEDYALGTNNGMSRPLPDSGGTTIDQSVPPGDAFEPIFFEPPGRLTNNVPQVWMASAGAEKWGGAVVYASTDNVTYQRIGTIKSRGNYGVLAAPLPAGDAHDSVNALVVDLHKSRGLVKNATPAQARDLISLVCVDDEYLAYSTEALAGEFTYRLSGLERGAYLSKIKDHPAGAPFAVIDGGIFKYNYPREWAGKTIYIKLCSFNVFNASTQDIATVRAWSYTIKGAQVVAASRLTASPLVFGIQLDWLISPALGDFLQSTEIWFSKTPSRMNASLLVSVPSPQSTFAMTGLKAGAVFYFWVRFIDKQGNIGEFYPAGDGVRGESATNANDILDMLTGVISKTQLAIELLTPIERIKHIDLLEKQVIKLADMVFEIPSGADLKELIARQRNEAAKSEAQAATQLYALAAADKAVSGARTQVMAKLDKNQAVVTDLSKSLTDKTQALGQRITTVQSEFNGNIAAVQTAINTVATANSALAQRVDTVIAEVGKNSAAIQTEQTARVNGDNAIAQQITTMQSSFNNSLAILQTKQTTQADNVSALTQRVDTLQAQVGSNSALIQTEQTARVNADGAIAQQITTLQTNVSSNSAAIQSESTARVSALGALSRRVDTVESATNSAVASVQTIGSTVTNLNGDMNAMYTIRTQLLANGRRILAGIGVGVESKNGVVESQVLVSAQRFAVIDESSGTLETPFAVQNGQTFIREAFIGDLTVGGRKITDNAVSEVDEFTYGIGDGTAFTVSAPAKVLLVASYVADYLGEGSGGTFAFGVKGRFTTPVAVNTYTSGGQNTVTISGTLQAGSYQIAVEFMQNVRVQITRCYILKVKK